MDDSALKQKQEKKTVESDNITCTHNASERSPTHYATMFTPAHNITKHPSTRYATMMSPTHYARSSESTTPDNTKVPQSSTSLDRVTASNTVASWRVNAYITNPRTKPNKVTGQVQQNVTSEMQPQFYFTKGRPTRWSQPRPRIACVDDRPSRSSSLDALTDSESQERAQPSSTQRSRPWSSRDRNTIITNTAQLVLGLALIQIGIVITWFRKFVQSESDRVSYVFFASAIYLFCGGYGIAIRLKRLRKIRSHQYGYITVACLSVIASVFISVVCVRMLIGDITRTLVMKTVSSLGAALSISNIILVALGTYYTLFKHSSKKKTRRTGYKKSLRQQTPCYISIYTILNITHIIIGVCVCELGMVGMIYKSIMNVKSNALFSTVFLSVTFIATGAYGIYCQIRKVLRTNLVYIVSTSMVSAACSAAILIAVVIALTGKYYYSGSEAILAFDYMILSLSSLELISSVASVFVIAIPTVKSSSQNPPPI